MQKEPIRQSTSQSWASNSTGTQKSGVNLIDLKTWQAWESMWLAASCRKRLKLTSNPEFGSQPIWLTCRKSDGLLMSSLVIFFGLVFPFLSFLVLLEGETTGAGAKNTKIHRQKSLFWNVETIKAIIKMVSCLRVSMNHPYAIHSASYIPQFIRSCTYMSYRNE